MLTTPKLGLKKPELTDSPPDITAMNPNWDVLDEALMADDLNAHLADTMPHRFTDGTTTYRWGLAVIDGVVNMVYEEVV